MVLMEFYEHLLVSSVIGVSASLYFGTGALNSIIIASCSIISGAFIDLDHFVISRVIDGNWGRLRKAFNHPLETLTNNEGIFGEKWLPPSKVITSHITIASSLGLFYLFTDILAIGVASISAFVHVAMDLIFLKYKQYI